MKMSNAQFAAWAEKRQKVRDHIYPHIMTHADWGSDRYHEPIAKAE